MHIRLLMQALANETLFLQLLEDRQSIARESLYLLPVIAIESQFQDEIGGDLNLCVSVLASGLPFTSCACSVLVAFAVVEH